MGVVDWIGKVGDEGIAVGFVSNCSGGNDDVVCGASRGVGEEDGIAGGPLLSKL